MSTILDPQTELPVDLLPLVNALAEWLADERVYRTALRRRVATPYALAKFAQLIRYTVDDVSATPATRTGLGRGKDLLWWVKYHGQVQESALRLLRDRVVRMSIARLLAQATGLGRHSAMLQLQQLRLDLETRDQIAS